MNVWEIVKAAGIPALVLGLIISQWLQIRAVKKGVQALLRDRLLQGCRGTNSTASRDGQTKTIGQTWKTYTCSITRWARMA